MCVCVRVCACVCLCTRGNMWGAHACICARVCACTHVCLCACVCVCGRAWLWWEGENDLKHTPKMPPPTAGRARAGPENGTEGAKTGRLHAGWAGLQGTVLSTQGAALLAGAEPHWESCLAVLQRKTFPTPGKPGNRGRKGVGSKREGPNHRILLERE